MLWQNWREAQRIKSLLKKYQVLRVETGSDSAARRELIGELQMRAGQLADQMNGLDVNAKDIEIAALFSPLDVLSYDVRSLVAFIVRWENPARYNTMPTIQQIRDGSDTQSNLQRRVAHIAERMGIVEE